MAVTPWSESSGDRKPGAQDTQASGLLGWQQLGSLFPSTALGGRTTQGKGRGRDGPAPSDSLEGSC